jgi:LuxR family maltose regulon positive regulatory protein
LLNADGIWTGIRLALTRGDWAAARALIAAARGPGVAAGFLRLTTLLDALAALADLGAGDVAAAARWADACGLEADLVTAGTLPHFRDVELLALADVRLTQGVAERAIPLLEAHIVQLRAGGRVPLLIAALIRLALAQEAEAHPAAADAALSEALTLAAPEGFVQVFRDAPVGLGPLLRRTRAVPAFSAGLLADFGLKADTATDDAPIEALSPTEARILALLAAGQSNAEIAAELVVSVGTAKWHVHNILRKLGVTSRLEAVAAAHELGLV